MNYYLTSSSVIDTNYTDSSGQVLYKVQTPFRLANSLTTISRVVPGASTNGDMRDVFEEIARIKWKSFKYDGDIFYYDKFSSSEDGITVGKLFRKSSVAVGWYGRPRTFTASNGKDYKWKLGFVNPELFRCSDSKLVARFHHKGLLSRKPSFLQITEDEEIKEEILLTFIYIEELRKDRERASKHAN